MSERTGVLMSVCVGRITTGEIQTLQKQTIKPPELLLTRQKQMCRFSKYLWTTRKMLCLPPPPLSALVSENED